MPKRRWAVVLFMLTCAAAVGAASRVAHFPVSPAKHVLAAAVPYPRNALSQLDVSLARLDEALATGDERLAQHAFRVSRADYKRGELYVEYYAASRAREFNGVPLPTAQDEDPETPLAPVGLQMVETILFPHFDRARSAEAHQLVRYMRGAIRDVELHPVDSMPGDAYLFDAMRQELARISTLGIAGFDATLSGDAIVESAAALDGVRDAFAPYRPALASHDPRRLRALDSAFAGTVGYLRAHPAFEQFDRMEFLSRHAIPLAHALAAAQQVLGIGAPDRPRAWSAAAASIYDRGAIDARFFAATDAPPSTRELVTLGRDLFAEPALSPAGRSCATCHVPERAFTDGRSRAAALPGHRSEVRLRNTPTLLNAGLQPSLFADSRVRTLEDQATDVLGSPAEMGGSLLYAANRVASVERYRARFASVFRQPAKEAVTTRAVRLALAAYVRSLTRLDAPFDRAVRGDSAAMSPEARNGFNLFMGKAGCATCHFPPLFGGAMPPTLVENEPEVIGVPQRWGVRRPVIDPDSGRFNVRRIEQHLHAFRTPTLRNVALTAPYMHNGALPTLESVVDFYDAGGGRGIGATVPHQTLPADSLHLTAIEKRAIVAFMRALTDTVGTTARPVH